MDRNQLIGFVLLGLLVIGYMYFQPATETEEKANTEQVENTADTEPNSTGVEETKEDAAETIQNGSTDDQVAGNISEVDSAQRAILEQQVLSKYGVFAGSSIGEKQSLVLENNRLKTTISNQGGMFETAVLQDGYTRYNSDEKIQLWRPDKGQMNLSFNYSGKGEVNTADFFMEVISSKPTATENEAAHLKLRLKTDNPAKYIDLTYTLAHDTYEVGFDMNIVGLDGVIDPANQQVALNWDIEGISNEKSAEYERQSSSVFYREMGEDRDYLTERSEQEETLEEDMHWFSFKQKFFSALVVNEDGFKTGSYIASRPPENEEDTTVNMLYSAKALMDIPSAASSNTSLRFYLGPNDFKPLKAMEVEELTRIIDYGPWIIGWVNRNVVRPIFFFIASYIGNLGVVILLLTILIKMVLFPVTWKNYLSSAKMRVLKPEINEISAKYPNKEDAVKKQQETMALYRQTGVNPFAGCIPVILQMPILYAMFRFFPASIELRGAPFLWADDLAAHDVLINLPWDIPAYGAHVSGFTVLMAISTFFYTRLNSGNMPDTQQPGMPNMKVIMNFFPIIMLVFFNKFASGLSLYYFVANLISIGQMIVIKRYIINEDKIRAKIETNKEKPRKKSSFQQRLEEMQKQQQAKLKQQRK